MKSKILLFLRLIPLLIGLLLGGFSFLAGLSCGALVRRRALACGLALAMAVALSSLADGPTKLPHSAGISIFLNTPVYIDGAPSLIATLVLRLIFAWWGCMTGLAWRAGFEEARALPRIGMKQS